MPVSKSGAAAHSNVIALAATIILAAAASHPAYADEAHTFHIAAAEASTAVREFAQQSGLQVMASASALADKKLKPVTGEHSNDDALQILLADSGLEHEYIGERGVAITAATAANSQSTGVAEKPAADAKGDQKRSFWDRFRVARADQPQDPRAAEVSGADADSTASSNRVEEITVTGSRISRAGFSAPTPTTVLDADALRAGGATDIGAALVQLPAQRSTVSPAVFSSSIYGGVANADLRGLGPQRTLVLVDGRRQPVSNIQGFNLNQLPFSMVKSVEVVTGGASAAWGSDAVSGVINLIIDKDFDGFNADVWHGVSSEGDGDETTASFKYGTGFAKDRGHFMIAAEYVDAAGITPKSARDYVSKWSLIAIPGTSPIQQTIAPDVNSAVATPGGLITSGPLAGTQFLDGGVTAPFQYGTLRGATLMAGGDPNAVSNNTYSPLVAPVERANAYARGTFDLTDDIQLTTDLNWAKSTTDSHLFPQTRTIVIRSDNAFLPAALRSSVPTQFNLGRVDQDIGALAFVSEYETKQGTIALQGKAGSNWRWDTYYTHARNDFDADFSHMEVTARFNLAIDSVLDPSGQPVCRSTLTAPANGCIPFNPFGPMASSEAARDYVSGIGWQRTQTQLDVAAATLRGEPFATWAGPVSLATGVEWRRYSLDNVVDPVSAAGGFGLLNVRPISGSARVKEGFVETVVPLATDLPFVKSLELNGAVRVSDYSLSGSITSWKAGLNYSPTDELRFRGTRSRDIRAPSLAELFTQQTTTNQTVVDPASNTQLIVPGFTRGNANLDPEIAATTTLGVIYSPAWLERFRASIDYYDIAIDDAIASLSGQDILTRCAAGNQALCGLVTRNVAGTITSIDLPTLNFAKYKTSGFDVEIGYTLPTLFSGTLDLRLLGTNVRKLKSSDGVKETDLLGNLGVNLVGAPFGLPKWRFTSEAKYQRKGLGLDLRARYTGSGTYNSTINLDDNTVPAIVYFDLGAEYRFGLVHDADTAVYLNVANLFDKRPPELPNPVFYDIVGRYMSLGVRVQY